jgi:hypothetical protein
MHDNLVPDVSLGTHFFNGLIEMEILYVAIFPRTEGKEGLDVDYFEKAPNHLADLVPEAVRWADVIRVIDPAASPGDSRLHLCADSMEQSFLCYLERS